MSEWRDSYDDEDDEDDNAPQIRLHISSLERIDACAQRLGMNTSDYITQAIMQRVEIDEALARAVAQGTAEVNAVIKQLARGDTDRMIERNDNG